jgi:hypothetical protein
MIVMCASETDIGPSRWDNEGGAPMARGHLRTRRSASVHPAKPALYYFNVRSGSALTDDPEGSALRDTEAAIEAVRALACDSLAAGDRRGENRREWQIEIMNRANRQVAMLVFAEACAWNWQRKDDDA